MTYPVLYSFRRCPYAMRARLAILMSETSVELREVVLRDKPQEMLDVSPKGTVPVLVLPDGKVIEESLDVMMWALSQYDPEGWLSTDMERAQELIMRNDNEFKTYLDQYKYWARYKDVDPDEQRAKAALVLADLNDLLRSNTYLLGDKASIADYALFPFIRQFAHVDIDWFRATPYTALQKWFEEFLNSDLFKAVMIKYPQWHKGDEQVLFGGNIRKPKLMFV